MLSQFIFTTRLPLLIEGFPAQSKCSVFNITVRSLQTPHKVPLSHREVLTFIPLLTCRHCFTKAEQLRQRHEEVLAKRAAQETQNSSSKMNTDSNSSGEDETDFDEFLNWRAKIS